MPVFNLGENCDLTYKYEYLGNNIELLNSILGGDHYLSAKIVEAKNPMLIIGQDALSREDGLHILKVAANIAEKFNVVRVGGLDVGFIHEKGIDYLLNNSEVLYLLGADELEFNKIKASFVIYQGHHGDKGAHYADVILPGASYSEKDAIYVNTEGRAQKGYEIVSPPGIAKKDVDILFALAEKLGVNLEIKNLTQVREELAKINHSFGNLWHVTPEKWRVIECADGKFSSAPFEHKICNFYMTDPISRASKTMSKCRQHHDKYSV
jgi:NADH-quinone oxidoreductase subunit G